MKQAFEKWLTTFTKRAVTAILVVSLIDIQWSYVLASIGKEQIAESLSSNIATMVIGVMIGYFCKALFETFLEKREERLLRESDRECEEGECE